MKGIIFNLFEEVVAEHCGEDLWDDLLQRAQVGGAYTSLGSYPDAEIAALATAAASRAVTLPQVLRWLGRSAIPRLSARYPAFFVAHTSLLPLLGSLNGVIHPEVRKLYPGAVCPHFDMSATAEGALRLGYRSARRLCHLAHGFIEGTAAYYSQGVEVRHLRCMHAGDADCLLEVCLT